MANDDLVLITGLSGFIAKQVALAVLRAGFRVRGTVRSAAKGQSALMTLGAHGADPSAIEFVEADLGSDGNWDRAAAGCRYVVHTASPFPPRVPRDRLALVPIARDGTLRVLAAAEKAGVERAVVTSSVAAIYYGHEDRLDPTFTEADFSDVDSPAIGPYAISKTLAERAAWEFASSSRMSLAAINPAFVVGPLLDDEYGTSIALVRMMMRGRMPVVPRMTLGVVDVRDVAEAHLQAMIRPEAGGRRFICSAGSMAMMEIARAAGDAVPPVRRHLPKATLPDIVVRLASFVLPEAAQALPELGRTKRLVAEPARNILGVTFVPPAEAVGATARSLAERGLLDRDPS